MSQINYYPKDKPFTEISASFFGSRLNPRDLTCYLKLLSLNKKLQISYPEYVVESNFFSYGNYLKYGVRTILDRKDKRDKINIICSELIRYGIKTNSIPIIEIINYDEHTNLYTLNEYLKSKKIKLEELNVEELSENLDKVR